MYIYIYGHMYMCISMDSPTRAFAFGLEMNVLLVLCCMQHTPTDPLHF